jgi:hypothetical protein
MGGKPCRVRQRAHPASCLPPGHEGKVMPLRYDALRGTQCPFARAEEWNAYSGKASSGQSAKSSMHAGSRRPTLESHDAARVRRISRNAETARER